MGLSPVQFQVSECGAGRVSALAHARGKSEATKGGAGGEHAGHGVGQRVSDGIHPLEMTRAVLRE